MAEAVVLEFSGVGETEYDAVNEKLGIDPKAGTGNWPAGLRMHAAGYSDDGTFIVSEIWTSRAAQAEFMHTRLGDALAAGGVTSAPKVTWFSVLAYQTPNA